MNKNNSKTNETIQVVATVNIKELLGQLTRSSLHALMDNEVRRFVASDWLLDNPGTINSTISTLAPPQLTTYLSVIQKSYIAAKHLKTEGGLEAAIVAMDEDDLYEAMDQSQVEYVFQKHLEHTEQQLVDEEMDDDQGDMIEAGLAIDKYLATAGTVVPVELLPHLRTIASLATGKLR